MFKSTCSTCGYVPRITARLRLRHYDLINLSDRLATRCHYRAGCAVKKEPSLTAHVEYLVGILAQYGGQTVQTTTISTYPPFFWGQNIVTWPWRRMT